jgi:hypothetical protein
MKTKYKNIFINPDFHDVMFRTPIAFDLDSVMNNLGHDLGLYIAREFGVTFEDVRDSILGYQKFHFEVDGVDYREIGKVVDTYVMEESPSALPSPFMSDVMKYVHELTGVPIAVVTARNDRTVGVTKRWLEEHLDGTPFHAYIINGPGKEDTLSLLKASIFVDDRWNTINGLVSKIRYPVLYTRPWNTGRPIDLPVPRVRDLRDIIPLLNIVARRGIMDWPDALPYPKLNNERGDTCFKC